MRNLEITRQKSFVGCLGTMKVYIEDPFSSEITISGVPCRLLGTLKNGEQKTFSIDDEARRIFVIPGKLSKNITCESYPLPAGTEDVQLSGKNHYNPFAGNPFYFDGNTDPAALAIRKKGARTGIIVLICAALVGFAVGFLLTMKPADKVFTCDGMQITLNSHFVETEYIGYNTVYKSPKTLVFVLKESFSLYPNLRGMTLKEYGEAVIKANKHPGASTVKTEQGITYFDYEYSADGKDYYYFTSLHRTEDGFWIVQFATNIKDADKMRPDFIEWAQSIEFNK